MSALPLKATLRGRAKCSALRRDPRCLLFRSLLGVKRTWAVAPHMSASDPKRTLALDLAIIRWGTHVAFWRFRRGDQASTPHSKALPRPAAVGRPARPRRCYLITPGPRNQDLLGLCPGARRGVAPEARIVWFRARRPPLISVIS